MNHNAPKVGFAFSSKDRIEFSRRSLRSIDTDGGFDLIWVDGSASEEGRRLPESTKLRNTRLVELHSNVRGGPDAAIRFGLRRLLTLGYDYCGLIENDMEFVPGWFSRVMQLFQLGEKDGLQVGAATTRTFLSRALTIQSQYATLWNIGAGMTLFTREAAEIVVRHYRLRRSLELSEYFQKKYDNNLKQTWEVWMDKYDRWLGCDWGYAMELDRRGLSSLGTIPSFSYHLDLDPVTFYRSEHLGGIAGTASEVPERDIVPTFGPRINPAANADGDGDKMRGRSHPAARLTSLVLRLYWKLRLPFPLWLARWLRTVVRRFGT